MGKICGVYLIVSPSNRRYVGSAKNIGVRWWAHKNKKDKRQSILYNSFSKYGVEKHEFRILFECEPDERLRWERIFGDLYLSLKDFGGLNMLLPGYDDIPQIFSQEQRKKIADTQRKISLRPENIVRQKAIASKYLHSEEARNASRQRLIERFKDPKQLEKQRTQAKRFQNTEEAKQANRERVIKRFKDQEKRVEASKKTKEHYKNNPEAAKAHGERMSKMFSNSWFHPKSKMVVNIISGQLFSNIKEAAKDAKMDHVKLSHLLRNKRGRFKPESVSYRFYE